MDDRQRQIQEGAGLTESRLNVEFIEWLRRYSTPIMVVLLVAIGSYVGWTRWQQHRAGTIDAAFVRLESARVAGSPSGLLAVADEHADERAVPLLARLDAADVYLRAGTVGVRPGATLGEDGTPTAAEDMLTPEQRAEQLRLSEEQYLAVATGVADQPAQAVLAIRAQFGLAAIAESRSDAESARTAYTRLMELARANDFPGVEAIARARLESLATLGSVAPLLSRSQVVTGPPAPPPLPPATGEAPGADGATAAPAPEGAPSEPPAPETGESGGTGEAGGTGAGSTPPGGGV